MASSTTGEFHGPTNQPYLEAYNLTRGTPFRVVASADPTTAVLPATPIRWFDGEKAEDWIADNSKKHLGFKAGKDPGDPGFSVFFLNTWDSPEAIDVLPRDEYHNFLIDRQDPDRQDFDGIDWARVWGGRNRFMMVDLGAAPNPYEAETWGNRTRSVLGSAIYDPPLWEYRANAPRPVTAVHLADGLDQAVTPGASWDDAQLQYMMGRSVNQAVNFTFARSYLYEPRPGAGSFYLSDNVWHDATTLYQSDLLKLYHQKEALTGLATLTPYFKFGGDVKNQYLDDVDNHPEYAADQAALDQTKADGDDVAGVPHISLHTATMMDYIDANGLDSCGPAPTAARSPSRPFRSPFRSTMRGRFPSPPASRPTAPVSRGDS